MAVIIQDELSDINKKVIDLKNNANTAAQKVRTLGEELKFDPQNVKTMQERLAALNDQVKKYTEYQDALKVKQQKLQEQLASQQEQLKKINVGTIEYQKLENSIKKTSDQLNTAERRIKAADNTLERLENTTRLYNKQLETTQKQLKIDRLNRFNTALGEVQKTINKVQVALVLLLSTVAKLTKEHVQQGTELYTLSKRYSTNAEDIQKYNKALQLATGESDLFTESLKVMSKGLATIPVGRGVAYNNALRAIGVSFQDIKDKNPAEQFQVLVDGLQNLNNEYLAGSYALTLFGESGQTIINALQSSDETLEEYLEKAKEFVVYTQEDTEILANLGFQLDAAKVKLQRATTELAVNVTPAIVSILDVLRETALPLLVGLTKQTGLLKAAFVLLIAFITTKGIVAFIQLTIQIQVAAAEQKKLLAWTLGVKAAILGFAGVIGVIATVGAAMATANSQLEDFANNAKDAYGSVGDGLNTSVETYASQSTDRTITVNANIHGEGDTTISDEAAKNVAQLTVEELQKQLGDLIK